MEVQAHRHFVFLQDLGGCLPRVVHGIYPFAQLIRLFVSRLKNLCRYYVLCLVLVGFNLYTCSRLNTKDQLGKSSSEEAEYRGLLSKWFHSFNHIYWSPSHMHSSTSKSIMMKGWCTSFSPYFTCFFFRCECLKSLIFLRRRVSASTPHTSDRRRRRRLFRETSLIFPFCIDSKQKKKISLVKTKRARKQKLSHLSAAAPNRKEIVPVCSSGASLSSQERLCEDSLSHYVLWKQ